MYQLFVKKSEFRIEVKPLSKTFRNIEITDQVEQYNDYYYFCKSRKALKEKALEIKSQWVKEAEDMLKRYESIEIK
jgi:hypothetical protein